MTMILSFSLYCVTLTSIVIQTHGLEFVSREEWGARPPKNIQKLNSTPIYAFIHHSYIPAACYNLEDCIQVMQWMQNFHMDTNDWDDIGYSFAVGSDGRVYVGRGWDRVGAHTKNYNTVGLGFVVIGDYRFELPNKRALNALSELIAYGVKNGKLVNDYILKAHRDVRATECPGQAFFDIIRTWPHYEGR